MKPFLNLIILSSRFQLNSLKWFPISRRIFIYPSFPGNQQRLVTTRHLRDEQTRHIVNRGSQLTSKADTKQKRRFAGREKDKTPDLDDKWKGKLLPTTSHLFKLIVPLPKLTSTPSGKPLHAAYLLHPSQPLSHVSGLIAASLSAQNLNISFRSDSPDDTFSSDIQVEWSDSTDLGDFIKSVVSMEHFDIVIRPPGLQDRLKRKTIEDKPYSALEIEEPPRQESESPKHSQSTKEEEESDSLDMVITVQVPSFQDRTQFLRRRLQTIDKALGQMEVLKQECDREAHQGARRLAVSGFGMLLVYWLGVARLTFYDYGWDIMEPITYLSGLTTVICGYLWFLYKGREVSYTSVLSQSVSSRRISLYKSRGFDLERWADLITERKAIRRDMSKIAEDYDVEWDGRWEDDLSHTGSENKAEEKNQIKQQTIRSDVQSHKDIGKAIAVDADHDGHDRLAELDKEANRQRRDNTGA